MAAASCSRPSISFVKTRTNRNHIIIPIVVTKRFLSPEGSIAISNKSLSICNCVKRDDEDHFVRWFREAWPYIRGHRGSTFVVVISGEIVSSPHLNGILQDISLLHGLGIKFILVPGTHIQIDKLLTERGKKGVYVGRYRVTDSDSLTAAMEASGSVRQTIEAKLSPGPPTLNLRRHGAHPRWQNLGVNVATGNFLAAKKRGVVEGVDYGYTGEVKKIEVEKIKERLDRDSVVIMSNLGYSSSGQVLNCNTYEVATACALAIKADKMICITDGDIFDGQDRPIRFMSLSDADRRIKNRAKQSQIAANYAKHFQFGDKLAALENQNHVDKRIENRAEQSSRNGADECIENRAEDLQLGAGFQNGVGFEKGNGLSGFAIGGEERFNKLNGFLSELAASAYVCQGGVQRVHIINGSKSGALLLELFTRDGVGTMIARDVYEGTRVAREEDLDGIKRLLRPLEDSGVLIRRTNQELIETLESFIVVEREGFIIACAALFPYFENKCAEVAAIAVSPECRGHGQGDKLLDYIEKKAISIGLQKLFLLTTRTADWFERRGFIECSIELLPRERRKKINISRGSKCYIKELQSEKSGGMIIRDYAVNKS